MDFDLSDWNTPEPIKTWEDWKKESGFKDTDFSINAPSWVGRTKGGNPYDFSNNKFVGLDIYKAFAEGMTISNSSFENVLFEEGDFSRVDFSHCTFINTKFNKTILTDSNFSGATFINCNLNRVNLTNADFTVKEIKETVIYGVSLWDIKISEESLQSKLVIEKTYDLYSDIIAEGRIPMMVEDIELAQFIYYLSDHKKLRDTLNILNNRGVLLLGRFKNGGLERLYKLREWFTKRNYLPMIFDFDRPNSLDYTETIVTMSGLSKLVIADLSGDSVPQELHAILSTFIKPVVVYYDTQPYSMIKDLKRKNRYFHDIKFNGEDDDLLKKLPDKIKLAETDYSEIIVDLAKEYS